MLFECFASNICECEIPLKTLPYAIYLSWHSSVTVCCCGVVDLTVYCCGVVDLTAYFCGVIDLTVFYVSCVANVSFLVHL